MLCAVLTIETQKYLVRKEVKQMMIQGISKERLELIMVTPKTKYQLDWEHDAEFEFRGEMFDVIYQESTGDTIRYWCWRDHKESNLNRELALLLDKHTNHQQSNQDNEPLLAFFKSLYAEVHDYISCCPNEALNPQPIFGYLGIYSTTSLDLSTPPPEG